MVEKNVCSTLTSLLRIYSNPKILKLKLGCCWRHTINQLCFYNEKVTPAGLSVNNSSSCLVLYCHGLIVRLKTRYHRFGNFIIIFGLGGCCSRKSSKVGPPLWKILNHIVIILYAFSLIQNFSHFSMLQRLAPSLHLLFLSNIAIYLAIYLQFSLLVQSYWQCIGFKVNKQEVNKLYSLCLHGYLRKISFRTCIGPLGMHE